MNSIPKQFPMIHRFMSILGVIALIVALLPTNVLSQGSPGENIDKRDYNPTPEKCCQCIILTVCSASSNNDEVDGESAAIMPRTGSYQVNITVSLRQIYDQNGNNACDGLEVRTLFLRSTGSSSHTIEVDLAQPLGDGDTISVQVDAETVRKHGKYWEAIAYCSTDASYEDGKGCKQQFEMGGGCFSCPLGECGYSSEPIVDMSKPLGSIIIPAPNGDGITGGHSSGAIVGKINGMDFTGLPNFSTQIPDQPSTVINRNGNGDFVSCQFDNGSSLEMSEVPGETAVEFTQKDPATNDYRTTKISKVNEGGDDIIRIDTTFNLTTWRYERKEIAPDKFQNEYGRVDPMDGFQPLRRETVTKTVPTAGTHVFLNEIQERPTPASAWFVASEVETTHEKQIYGWVKTKEVIDPAGDALTSTWDYYQPGEVTGPGNSIRGLGWIKQHNRYDGYQSFHVYGLNYESVTTPYQDDPSGKLITTQWNPGTETRTVTTTVGGKVLSKTEMVYSGETAERRVYTSDGAYLATKTTYKASGSDFGGKPVKIEHPDGTLTTYEYTRLTGGGFKTVMKNGANGGGTVSLGMSTETIRNSRGTVILSKTTSIGYPAADGKIFGSMAVTAIDNIGRPTTIEYHPDNPLEAGEVATGGNPSWTTTKQYGCCGVTEETDKYGIKTRYAYDGIKRRIRTNRIGVTMETVRTGFSVTTGGVETHYTSNESHRVAEVVSGTLGSAFQGTAASLIGKSVSNISGTESESHAPDPTSTTDGALIVSSKSATTYQPGAGLSSSVVTSVPDTNNGWDTQTTISYLDGKTSKTTGALSPEMEYSYAVNDTGEEVTLSYLDGAVVKEATLSQSDWAGRSSKIRYQDNAEATSHYNSKGQLVRAVDPDGVVTLLKYNTEGEQTTRAIDLFPEPDLTYDNEVDYIDYGTDQISYSETDPGADGADPAFITTSKVWQPGDYNENAGTITNTYKRSPDGLSSSSQALGVANASTTVTDLQGSNGDWTVTNTSPDGTKQVQTYTDGLLTDFDWLDTNDVAIAFADYDHDSVNRQITTTDSRTGVVTTVYLSLTNDLVASVIDAGSRATAFTYDERGRRTHVDAPDSGGFANITQTIYNSDSTVAEITGEKTYRTTYTYDYADRKVSMTTYGTQQATTSWVYSADRGFLTTKTYPANGGVQHSTTYTYTDAGRLLTRASARPDASGVVVTHYGYDDAGRLVSIDYDGSTPDVVVTYDSLSRKTQETNGVATCDYTYSSSTLVLIKEDISYDFIPGGTPEFSRTIDRTQDALLRSSGCVLKDGTTTEQEVAYAYGAGDGRLETVSKVIAGNPNLDFNYAYEAKSANLVDTVTGPVHTVDNKWETTRNVLDAKQNIVGGSDVSKYDYTVNNYGQRTDVATSGSAFTGTPTWAWSYNATGEIVLADSTHNSYDRAYKFDGIGNRLEAVDGATSVSGTDNYTPNALNQYSAIGSINPVYDEDGNATAYPLPAHPSANSSLEWDAENRLIETTVNGTLTTYDYDAMSRRIRKKTGTNETVYVYDGWNLITQYETSSYTLEKTYTWGMDLSGSMQGAGGVGGLLAVTEGNTHYYPTYDGNGNVSEYLDGTGSDVAHYEYDPFGRIVDDSGTLVANFEFKFSTKLQDAETGLYYYGYRYYDPETGRWLNRDPIEESGGLSLYGFIGNDSISGNDYLGLRRTLSGERHHWFPQRHKDKIAEICGTDFNIHDYTTLMSGWAHYQIERIWNYYGIMDDFMDTSPDCCGLLMFVKHMMNVSSMELLIARLFGGRHDFWQNLSGLDHGGNVEEFITRNGGFDVPSPALRNFYVRGEGSASGPDNNAMLDREIENRCRGRKRPRNCAPTKSYLGNIKRWKEQQQIARRHTARNVNSNYLEAPTPEMQERINRDNDAVRRDVDYRRLYEVNRKPINEQTARDIRERDQAIRELRGRHPYTTILPPVERTVTPYSAPGRRVVRR